jgi:hypothetical protein
MKKFILFVFILFALLLNNMFAQIVKSVDVFAEYSMPGKKLSSITKIDGVGAGIKLQFPLYQEFSLYLNGGYTLYSLNEENALAGWQWEFWTRYNDFVRQTLSDAAYKNFMNPVQKMDLINLYLSVDYDFIPFEKFHVKPVLGGGIFFYNRRLYIDETWQKYFSNLNYTFEYEFRNIAPEKSGNTLFYTGGIDLNYEILQGFWLFGSVKYVNVFDSKLSYGFDKMPFKNSVNTNLGLTILY